MASAWQAMWQNAFVKISDTRNRFEAEENAQIKSKTQIRREKSAWFTKLDHIHDKVLTTKHTSAVARVPNHTVIAMQSRNELVEF